MDLSRVLDINKITIGQPIKEVYLECMVALKIIQHCKQNSQSESVTGQLLGLDFNGQLEITDSFPLPLRQDDEEDRGSAHALEMMKCLRDVVDNNTVGWYYSSFLEFHINQFLLETQFSYQSQLASSVVLIYDPLITSYGSLGFSAYRLSDKFMELQSGPGFTKDSLVEHKFTFNDIFVNIPIRVRTFGLGEALLFQLERNEDNRNHYEHYDLSSNDFFHKNMEGLLYCLTDLQKEQSVHYAHQRNLTKLEQQQQQFILKRKQENEIRKAKGEKLLGESMKDYEIEQPSIFKKPPDPSCLESLLVSHRMDSHCNQILKHVGRSAEKEYVLKSFQGS